MKIGNVSELRKKYSVLSGLLTNTDKKTEGVPGVYLLLYGDRPYVGMASNLRPRLEWHEKAAKGEVISGGGVSIKYWNVVSKHRCIPKVYLLESGDHCKNSLTRSGLERMWILLFWKLVGNRMVNTMFVPAKTRQEYSKRDRLERALRMSNLIRSLHKDPEYKKKARQIARENWKKLPQERRREINRQSSERARKHFSNPRNRELQSQRVSRQWGSEDFREANIERLKRLQATGWKPIPCDVLKIVIPDGTKFILLKKDLSREFGIGGRVGGLMSFFQNPLFSDWSVSSMGSLSGKMLLSRKDELKDSFDVFRSHPFIQWIVRMKTKNPKFFNCRPVKFSTPDGTFRAGRLSSVRKGGRNLVPGLSILQEYRSLYAFATDKIPVWVG